MQYSISTAIPLVFDTISSSENIKSEFVQQIEVANSGNREAEKIVIRLSRPISKYYLSKHSLTEQAVFSNGKDGLEMSYPSLPPSTAFQLTVKTNEELTDHQIRVFHEAGKAKLVSPGARKTEFGLLDAFWFAVYAFNLFIIYLSSRDEFKYRYLFRRYSTNVDELLRSKKPWYIREADWPGIRTDLLKLAIATPISFYSLSSLTTSAQYLLLNSDQPIDIPQSDWDRLKDAASTRLVDSVELKARLARSSSTAEIYDLLSIQWPKGLSEAHRESAIKALSRTYLESLIRSCSIEDLTNKLTKDEKPTVVSYEAWERFKVKAEDEVVLSVAEKIASGKVESIELLPEWKAVSSRGRFKLTRLVELYSKGRAAEQQLASVREDKIKLAEQNGNLMARQAELDAVEKMNRDLRTKLMRQLEIIERLIADPSYINKIELYDDTFAPGNWAMLRQLVAAPT